MQLVCPRGQFFKSLSGSSHSCCAGNRRVSSIAACIRAYAGRLAGVVEKLRLM
jgi:hypothetical protein